MNSNYGKPNNQPKSLNTFDFDLGLGSSRPKSLKDQKSNINTNTTPSYSYSSTQSKPAWQLNKPSWTHQPAPTQAARPGVSNAKPSMVGDIFGKSWGSGSSVSNSGIGIVDKNPNLFGDLVRPAFGQGKSNNSSVPLKKVTPTSTVSGATSSKSAYTMGNLSDSLPKTGNSKESSDSWGAFKSSGSYAGGLNNTSANINKASNLGGPSLRSVGSGGVGGGMGSNKDPFGPLSDFGFKQPSSLNSANKVNKSNVTGGDAFGNFQYSTKASTATFPSGGSTTRDSNFMGSTTGDNFFMGSIEFGMPSTNFTPQSQAPAQIYGLDPLDTLFSKSSTSNVGDIMASEGLGGQFSEVDAWDTEFGGHDTSGTTTELDGLPPPPAGVTAPSAKNKGMDNYKQGQYADAIKWLSWAVILLEKSGDANATSEVLSCRASCYKEVGEYKKAVADCSQVLEKDDANVSVLVQRALLYESMEKYKLGAEDLRTVLKIDPINRVARSTIHRLTKLAD